MTTPNSASRRGCRPEQTRPQLSSVWAGNGPRPRRAAATADTCERARPAARSTGAVLGGIGAAAIGLSGVLAAVLRLVAGSRVLAAPAPHQVLSAADCARWLAADPAARTCRAAVTADWANEVIWYRIAIGLLGVVGLLILRFARKRWIPNGRWAYLPPAVRDTIAVTLFAIGGVWTLGMGIDAIIVSSGNGSGQWLSAAPVALLAAAVFAVRLIRDIEPP